MTNAEKFENLIQTIANGDEYAVEHYDALADKAGITGLNSLSDEDYEQVSQDFVKNHVIPSINHALGNTDPNTEEDDWNAFSKELKSAERFVGKGFDRDYATLKKFYGDVPLLKLANDKDQLNARAASQETMPGILKREILQAWEVQKKKNADKAASERAEATAKEREKIWESKKDYLGKAAKLAGRLIAPEFTNWAEESIKSGEEKDGMGKAILKDIAFNAASIVGGGAAGKAASMATRNAGRVAKVAAGAAAGGVSAGAAEAGREALSDYEELDPLNVAATVAAGGTISGFSKGIARNIGKVEGGRSVGSVVNKMVNGAESGVAAEAQKFKDAWAATVKNVKGAQTSIQREYSKELVAQRAKELGVTERTIRQYIRNGVTPKLYSGKVDDAFVMSYRNIMPEAFKEMGTVVTKGDRLKGGFIAAGLKASTNAGTRQPLLSQKTATIEQTAEDIGVDPTTIRMWDAGFAPRGEGQEQDLYKKWKQRYRSGK